MYQIINTNTIEFSIKYNNFNKNQLTQLIGARITNQLAFNLCIILNAIIIINFIIHSFASIKK